MGLFDFVKDAGKKLFGKDELEEDLTKPIKPIRQHLIEHGFDPENITIRYHHGGKVELEGPVASQEQREKIVTIVGNVQHVEQVDDRLYVDDPKSIPTGTAQSPGAGSRAEHPWVSQTYTVKKGDTLSGIAREYYGDASKYPRIYEANKPMLKDPDKIYPGQVLRIPPKE